MPPSEASGQNLKETVFAARVEFGGEGHVSCTLGKLENWDEGGAREPGSQDSSFCSGCRRVLCMASRFIITLQIIYACAGNANLNYFEVSNRALLQQAALARRGGRTR